MIPLIIQEIFMPFRQTVKRKLKLIENAYLLSKMIRPHCVIKWKSREGGHSLVRPLKLLLGTL